MPPPWQFISTSQPDGIIINPDSRRIIREHAMKSFRRGQRRRKVAEFQQKQPRVEAGDDGPSQTDPTASVAGTTCLLADIQGNILEQCQDETAYALNKQTAFLSRWPGDALDPFHKTAMYNHHDTPRLFMHFVHEIAPQLQPFGAHGPGNPMVSIWPLYAVQDSLVFESLIFHTAVHVDMRNGRPWSASTWYHRGRAIQLLSQRLAMPGDESTSNCVIGAVGFMSTVGNITGDVKQDLVHRKALRRMVEMSGGIDGLGYGGVLAMILPIGDLIASTVSDSRPILERTNMDAAATILGLEIPETFDRPIKCSIALPSFRVEIFTLISSIDKLAALHTDSINTLVASTENMIAFSQVCSGVEHRLLSVRIRKGSDSDSDPDAFVYEAARITGLMCMTYLFRKMDRISAIFMNLHRRLRATIDDLESSSTSIMDQDTMRLFLWVVSVGSLTALGQAWNLDELSDCLGFFIWTSKMASDFVKIWEQVEPLPEAFRKQMK